MLPSNKEKFEIREDFMGTKLKGAALAALMGATASVASVATAEELRFDRLFILGDSLSDGGTYSQAVQAAGGGLLPTIFELYRTPVCW